jgi:hypothetical protein
MHGVVVVWRVRSGGMVDWEVGCVHARRLRAAAERIERIFVVAFVCRCKNPREVWCRKRRDADL